jgi:hypothetical protein
LKSRKKLILLLSGCSHCNNVLCRSIERLRVGKGGLGHIVLLELQQVVVSTSAARGVPEGIRRRSERTHWFRGGECGHVGECRLCCHGIATRGCAFFPGPVLTCTAHPSAEKQLDTRNLSFNSLPAVIVCESAAAPGHPRRRPPVEPSRLNHCAWGRPTIRLSCPSSSKACCRRFKRRF